MLKSDFFKSTWVGDLLNGFFDTVRTALGKKKSPKEEIPGEGTNQDHGLCSLADAYGTIPDDD